MLLPQLLSRRSVTFLMSGVLTIGTVTTPVMAYVAMSSVDIAQPEPKPLLLGQALPDFEPDDGFEQTGEGFHAIYVDRRGNVLGTFVNLPNAQIKVYADGRIVVIEQDYTVETQYYSDGQIRTLGRTDFRYYRNERIRSIDDIDFRYFRSGRLRSIGSTDFDYSSSGQLQQIEDVRFRYDRDDLLETISAAETRRGIRIVVVD